MNTRKEVALLLNRLILMASAKAQQQPNEPPEDRIADAEIDALEAQILALYATRTEVAAPSDGQFCRFPSCKCPMDPGPDPDWCAIGLPQKRITAVAAPSDGTQYEGSAFVDGAWQPWHDITREVYENRQKWPREGYRVRVCPYAEVAAPSDGEQLRKALNRAFSLGQVYWQQADSEYVSQHKKADITQTKFDALVDETLAASAARSAEIQQLREALTKVLRAFPTDLDMAEAGWKAKEIEQACTAYDAARAALEKQ
jgi:hypothetical protein